MLALADGHACWQAGLVQVMEAGRRKASRRVCYQLESQWHVSVHELISLQAVVMHGCPELLHMHQRWLL